MLNFSPEQTLKLLARRRRTRPDVARKPWEWPSPADTPASEAGSADTLPPSTPATSYAASPGIGDGRTIDLTSPHVASYVLDDTPLRRNQRSIERHITDDHYIRSFTPGMFVLDGVATHVQIPAAAPQWPAVEFPDGVLSIATVSWRKPSEWRTGKLRLQFRYTSDVGSTNAFGIRYRVVSIRDAEVHPGTILSANPTVLSLAGPAVANTHVRSAYFYTTTSFGSDDEMFSVQIFRDGAADANNNDFHLIHLEVFHVSSVQEAT